MLNNGGGEIFHALPGLEMSDNAARYITATHQASAKAWAEDRGFEYHAVHNEEELNAAMPRFADPSIGSRPILMEAFTDKDSDVEILKNYYRTLKNKQ